MNFKEDFYFLKEMYFSNYSENEISSIYIFFKLSPFYHVPFIGTCLNSKLKKYFLVVHLISGAKLIYPIALDKRNLITSRISGANFHLKLFKIF